MKRAMGGAGGFAAQSPTVLVARALRQAAVSTSSRQPESHVQLSRRAQCTCSTPRATAACVHSCCPITNALPLISSEEDSYVLTNRPPAMLGEALSRRIGFERPAGPMHAATVLAATIDDDSDAVIKGIDLAAVRFEHSAPLLA